MNFIKTIGAFLESKSGKEIVGKDKRGNTFYTLPHAKSNEPARRMVDYGPDCDPSSIHPLWKLWIGHNRPHPPTDRDIFIWETEQARLRKRLKEIEEASTKMRYEEMADREREDFNPQNSISDIMSSIFAERNQAENVHGEKKIARDFVAIENETTNFVPKRPPTTPKIQMQTQNTTSSGSNIQYEDGKRIVPKQHTPYSPDPSRLSQILKKDTEPKEKKDEYGAPTSVWKPEIKKKDNNTDDL